MEKQGSMTAKRILGECQVFSALDDADLERIAISAIDKEYEAGSTIFQEGDRAEDIFVIREGRVALQISLSMPPGQTAKRMAVDIVTAKEMLGWSAIVEPYIYTRTAVCLRRTTLLSISGIRLRSLLRDNHHIGYEVLKGLIKVVASRLEDARRVLASERVQPPMTG